MPFDLISRIHQAYEIHRVPTLNNSTDCLAFSVPHSLLVCSNQVVQCPDKLCLHTVHHNLCKSSGSQLAWARKVSFRWQWNDSCESYRYPICGMPKLEELTHLFRAMLDILLCSFLLYIGKEPTLHLHQVQRQFHAFTGPYILVLMDSELGPKS